MTHVEKATVHVFDALQRAGELEFVLYTVLLDAPVRRVVHRAAGASEAAFDVALKPYII